MGVMKTPSAILSQSVDSDHSGDEVDNHSLDKDHDKVPWQRSFSFLRRGSSKRKKAAAQHNADTASVQSVDRHNFTGGLKPEHASVTQGISRTPSESSQLGRMSPSVPPSPISPHRTTASNHCSPFGSPSQSPGPFHRSPSPRRIDLGFASAVTNLVEQAHTIAEQERRKHKGSVLKYEDSSSIPSSPQMRGRQKIRRPPLMSQQNVIGSPLPSPHLSRKSDMYRSTSLETRSRSPSPNLTPTPSLTQEYYGSANLTDRSRSPSPSLSSPIETPPRRTSRKLPLIPGLPAKPSSLNLAQPKLKENMPRVMPSPTIPQPPRSPGSINFPKLNCSPTRKPKSNVPTNSHHAPPPGKLGRPEPYSPTERNNLNKPSSALPSSHSNPQRMLSRDHVDVYSSHNVLGHSPELNRSCDRRFMNQFDEPTSGSDLVRGHNLGISPSNMPNGYKRRKPEKLELRSDSNVPLTRDSDSESDWC
ncbi:hypothetical protein ACJMK2_040052 [Sinanodonta woodiana]|uniref:Uncharacterized protein n=1 Tax=Sinanodonta woodiana TaxID=1069815 RepID=A0ABD3WE01_SINWO